MTAVETLPPPSGPAFGHFADIDRYEIIDGTKVEMPPMSAKSTGLSSDLAYYLTSYGVERGVGKAYSEMLIKLALPVDRNRRPDVVFVPFSRWAKGRDLPSANAWAVLPDLCVEVVSPTDFADEQWEKVCEYFQAGVRLVWVVYPRQQHVHVYELLTASRVLGRGDTLDGGAVLPDFRLPLAELFPEPEPPAA